MRWPASQKNVGRCCAPCAAHEVAPALFLRSEVDIECSTAVGLELFWNVLDMHKVRTGSSACVYIYTYLTAHIATRSWLGPGSDHRRMERGLANPYGTPRLPNCLPQVTPVRCLVSAVSQRTPPLFNLYSVLGLLFELNQPEKEALFVIPRWPFIWVLGFLFELNQPKKDCLLFPWPLGI